MTHSIFLQVANGYELALTRLQHLQEQWVEAVDFVLGGQPLGAVGNTGNAVTTPPHLHFGVYVRRPGVRGGAQDPVDFLL